MEQQQLITEPDLYSPVMEEDGNYVDKIPNFKDKAQGLRCPCNNNVFSTRQAFSAHTKTRCHKQWLEQHNANRMNYLQELEQAKRLIHNQKLIIAQFELDNNHLRHTIRILSMTQHTNDPPALSTNLLEFD